ncbi:hypothetical protein I3843_03G059800 [Carya illinoinensis]|uniref:Uncharacterized protein n=1 Tax=Carya illinoinensis TaxID=32201 RepID=A0A8T1R0Y1_CARIL|nr:uncharacterized protein LOC122302836 [Carya illinoinensis]KAG2715020.1 hypothetical protein I3760_03G056900 [Carya illinoinensis]KAG6659832.1 hypothetical protein CIPAW_03G063500 [Carya illinoinensis]KAG6720401.1 hypothetical protein I3842_03G059300 [Carya illinoinensis]KAG7986048.1 hypothetical protein I3843_03G059800 [Carya illinoinensis]
MCVFLYMIEMATLQKFKLLATQCAVVAGSPTQSPSASPVIHLRRRKTLRMLLNRTDRRGRFSRQEDSPELRNRGSDPNRAPDNKKKQKKEKNEEVRIRHKLKDLFVSSPPLEDRVSDKRFQNEEEEEEEEQQQHQQLVGSLPENGSVGGGSLAHRRVRSGGAGSFRPITATFRYRLLRRAWRPVLVTIPE